MNFNEKSLKYSKPFIDNPNNQWIHNVKTKIFTLEIGGFIFPVSINEEEYCSSYVCSPYNSYVTYSQDELVKLKSSALKVFFNVFLTKISRLLKLGKINKNICINNFLLSTNPYPDWPGNKLKEKREEITSLYPDYTIICRSLNWHTNKTLIEHLLELNFILVPSRQVYIFDSALCDFMKKNNTHNDRRALRKCQYKLVKHDQINNNDYPTIIELYNKLYLQKYSKHNPQFSQKLIKYWHENQLLTMFGLRDKNGILQGIIGIFESEKVVTAPLVGYNTSLAKQNALYRMLIYLVLDYSEKVGKCLNLSSGASEFKLLRGGQAFIEYSAIYIDHLPFYRRITWKLIRTFLNIFFVPIVKKYKL